MSFRAKDLIIKRASNSLPLPSLDGVKFGSLFTPHMVQIHTTSPTSWGPPRIVPFENLSLPPQSACLHYALECFEGFKAYRDAANRIRLFRPEVNCERFLRSAKRTCLHDFDPEELLKVVEEFVRLEKDYVPQGRGYSLYLRPTAIGLSDTLSIAPPTSTMIFIIASPVGAYYSNGVQPVRLLVEEKRRRAFPGGTGGTKMGANYAGTVLVQKEAAMRGSPQVLWLSSANEVQEVGAMNFFCLWRPSSAADELELITAPLDDTILPGVTRSSILQLVRQSGKVKVSERNYTIDELIAALKENRVVECFGCGTAAIVTPVNALEYKSVEYTVPCPEPDTSLAHRMLNSIMDIQYGVVEHEWSRVVVG